MDLFPAGTRIVGLVDPHAGHEGVIAQTTAEILFVKWEDKEDLETWAPNQVVFVPKDRWLRAQKLYTESQDIFAETGQVGDDPAQWLGDRILTDEIVMDGRPLPVHLAIPLWAWFAHRDLAQRARKARVFFAVVLMEDGSVQKVPYSKPEGSHPDSCKAMEKAAESARALGFKPVGVYKRDMDVYKLPRVKELPRPHFDFGVILAMRNSV